jgi:hypothetical protein
MKIRERKSTNTLDRVKAVGYNNCPKCVEDFAVKKQIDNKLNTQKA